MSARVDQFCDQLRVCLNALEYQVDTLKSNLQRLSKPGEQVLQKSLNEARSRIEGQEKKIERAQASLMARAD